MNFFDELKNIGASVTFFLINAFTIKPAATAIINKAIWIITAVFGITESIKNASSPEVAIIAATKAPVLMILCTYNETAVYAPRHPGIKPRIAARKICFAGLDFKFLLQRPFVKTLKIIKQ